MLRSRFGAGGGTRRSPRVLLLRAVLTVALGAFLVPVTASQASAAGAFSVSTSYYWPGTANGRQMSAGQSVQWRGTVSPYVSTARVVIQYKVGSTWYDGARVSLTRSGSVGTFNVRQTFNSPGYKTIRLRVYSGTSSWNTWTGNPVNVTVYKWYSLNNFDSLSSWDPDGNSRCDFSRGSGQMSSTGYFYSPVHWQRICNGDYSADEYALLKKCTTFKTVYGVYAFTSDTATRSRLTVWGDGTRLATSDSQFSANKSVVVNISGRARLQLASVRISGNHNDVGMGDPQIRCSF